MLDPIRKIRISEQVAGKLEDLILDRKLLLGEQLPSERKLMEMLGVGRGAVREALRILEIKGYVESKQGIGAFVKSTDGDIRLPLSLWLADKNEILANIFEVRIILEPDTASLAAKRITQDEIAELRSVHEDFCENVQDKDLQKSIMADAEFHKLLALATKNRLLVLTMETLQKFLITGWKASLRVPGRSMKTVSEHEAILKSIERGDHKEAAKVMRRHLEDAVEELKKQGLDIEYEQTE